MLIDKNCKIELAAEKSNGTNDRLKNVYFRKDYAVATDAHIMSFVPVKAEETDSEGLLSAENLQFASKNSLLGNDIFMNINGDFGLVNGTKLPKAQTTFPDYHTLIPTGEPVFATMLDARLLYNLSRAMDTKKVVLEFFGVNKTIRVYDVDNNATFGLIASCRLDKDRPETAASKLIDSELND